MWNEAHRGSHWSVCAVRVQCTDVLLSKPQQVCLYPAKWHTQLEGNLAITKWQTLVNKVGQATALLAHQRFLVAVRTKVMRLSRDIQVAQRSHEGSCLSGPTRARHDCVYPRACARDKWFSSLKWSIGVPRASPMHCGHQTPHEFINASRANKKNGSSK